MNYTEFIRGKQRAPEPVGIRCPGVINPMLYDFQQDITRWALRRGRAAIFADCGLGKTAMQLAWAARVPGPVLIVAPLAVSEQTVREGEKFGVNVRVARHQPETPGGVHITNYEMLHHFAPTAWTGIVLDESSIIKHRDGKFRRFVTQAFGDVSFRLSCTATPAPNDHMELGTQAEFLGISTFAEMLATYFVHDGGNTSQWRLKGHAECDFWRWVCSWAVMIRKPSDLGYADDGFDLPGIEYHDHMVRATHAPDGMLFPVQAHSLSERLVARRSTVAERAAKCAELVNASDEPWIVWCNLNAESEALGKAIPDAVTVRGADPMSVKRDRLLGFSDGEYRVLVTKPKIAGHGMNWQHCRNVAFVGLSDSWEQYYQAVRRCWRFLQERTVHVHIITADTEGAVVANIKRKEADALALTEGMVANMSDLNNRELWEHQTMSAEHQTGIVTGEDWALHRGDCVDVVREIEADSIDYTIFSPPFASLYTYTDSPRDMGNCVNDAEFRRHFGFLVGGLLRVTKPGRLLSFHCFNIPSMKARDGVIGLKDFRGDLIRSFVDAGWIYHSEVCIWKDPVTAMQRTKALGLLHKQLKKDACMSRQGIADYLVTMRKPGDNPDPVANTDRSFPVKVWQRYASPVWMDINPSDTIQHRSAREHADERHICPLQLGVIRRAVRLWTNTGDLVFSPFAGIGSEGYIALKLGRRFVGVELKGSYHDQACRNIDAAVSNRADLFTPPATDGAAPAPCTE